MDAILAAEADVSRPQTSSGAILAAEADVSRPQTSSEAILAAEADVSRPQTSSEASEVNKRICQIHVPKIIGTWGGGNSV